MNEEDNKKDQGGAQSQQPTSPPSEKKESQTEPSQGAEPSTSPQQSSQPPQTTDSSGAPPQGAPPQGMPPQGMPPQGTPPQGTPPQGMPPQGMPPQGTPQQGTPQQGMPQQGMPSQGMPPQGMPPQGTPPQGAPPQGMPQQSMQPPPEDTTPANFQLGTKLPPELKVKAPQNNLSFDEDSFIRLLAGSISLSKDEKKRIVESIPKLRQAQIDELIRIFEEEKQKFSQLSQKHVPQLEKLAQQHYLEWMELEDEVEKAKKQKEDESKADEIRKNLGL